MTRVPTTDEMDGLYSEEDKRNRNKVVYQCRSCKQWTQHDHVPLKTVYKPCHSCGKVNYDATSIKSLRSYNPLTDIKRKPK